MSDLKQIVDQLETEIPVWMKQWQVPGVSLGVLHNGTEHYRAFGIANISTDYSLTPETLLQIGSISKIFTTTLIMSLVDDDLLSIDVPIINYLPDLPLADERARQSITLRHLLTHMSGFYGDRFDDQGYGDDALAKAVAAYSSLRQQTAPGELWTYCNAGFDLAGRIVEVTLNQRFEDAMRERVFVPTGLERITYFAQEAILHPVAVGHGVDGESDVRILRPWPIPRRSNAAGGISTTTADLLRFGQMHMNNGIIDGHRVISEAASQLMRTKQVDADAGRTWGVGWALRTIDNTLLAEHGGSTNGFAAKLTIIPEKSFAIAILTNGEHGANVHSAISATVLEHQFGLVQSKPKSITLDEQLLAKYAGHYRHDLADFDLVVDGNGFQVTRYATNPFSGERAQRPSCRFVPTGDRRFVTVGGDLAGAEGDFILNKDGSVRFLRFGGRLAYPVSVE